MHLGATPWNFSDLSAASLAAQGRFAENLGFDSLWLPENHFNPGAIPDPLMLLATVATVTERLKLGTTSYLLTLRNPLQAAEQVAVLDQLSAGRVILGIGRGYAPDMLAAFKVVPKNKRRILSDTLEVMCQAWSGVPVAVSDDPAITTTVTLDPLPVQRPYPPLWMAAFGPKALAQAGRMGMPYLASPMESIDELEINYRAHREALLQRAVDTGDTGEKHEAQTQPMEVPVMRSVYISSNAAENKRLREALGSSRQRLGQPDQLDADQWAIIGDAAYARDKIAEYQERLGMNALVATRLRIPGLETQQLEQSLRQLVEIVL